ncbi:hypothetical protein [Stutzerimonas stutzeri]|uniref:hypothetical protein n=1 Tax=Stutzerimonas stutzeri TaxID=316 RepID=UPI0015E2E129|nr:hypothetical protein [Stutzerimonas stutzeri]MBA1280404.1 hypothetical protein [Stutzerimonas stutzeri]
MRDDIWYRGQYRPVSTGEYRVTLSEAKVWLVDRAGYDSRGQLSWEAEPHDSPAAIAALEAHRLMREQLDGSNADQSGYFLPEQLSQWAASIAGSKASGQGARSTLAAAIAVARVTQLIKMPLVHALANLQREALIPDTSNALQAQLLMFACKIAGEKGLIGTALDMQQRDTCSWLDAEAIQRHPDVSCRLPLASPTLINELRRLLETSLQPGHSTLANAVWHFDAGTEADQVHQWIARNANHPMNVPEHQGSVRVLRDWTSQALVAERYGDESGWEPLDSGSQAKAAIAAYNWAQDHVPASFPALPFQREYFCQSAAAIASASHDAPLQAAQAAIIQAKKQASTYYSYTEAHGTPVVDGEDVHYDLNDVSVHRLTCDGIKSFNEYLGDHPALRQHSLDAMMLTDQREVALSFTVADPSKRLHLKCEPKIYLRLREEQSARNDTTVAMDPLPYLQQLAAEAGLGHYHFRSVDSLSEATLQPNEYRLRMSTDTSDAAGNQNECQYFVDTFEPSEVVRLFRDKGVTPSPSVEQYGDGSWSVTWRSESPEENREYFEQGIHKHYTFSLLGANGEPVNPEIAQVFAEEAGVTFSNPYAPNTSKGLTPKFG